MPREKAEKFASEKGMSGFFETSAKSGDNVEASFMTAARRLFKQHYRAMMIDKQRNQNGSVKNRKLRQQQAPTTDSNNCGC